MQAGTKLIRTSDGAIFQVVRTHDNGCVTLASEKSGMEEIVNVLNIVQNYDFLVIL